MIFDLAKAQVKCCTLHFVLCLLDTWMISNILWSLWYQTHDVAWFISTCSVYREWLSQHQLFIREKEKKESSSMQVITKITTNLFHLFHFSLLLLLLPSIGNSMYGMYSVKYFLFKSVTQLKSRHNMYFVLFFFHPSFSFWYAVAALFV